MNIQVKADGKQNIIFVAILVQWQDTKVFFCRKLHKRWSALPVSLSLSAMCIFIYEYHR